MARRRRDPRPVPEELPRRRRIGTAVLAGTVALAGIVLFACTAPSNPPGHHHGAAGRSVVDLVDASTGPADVRVELVARTAEIALSTGQVIDAWTFGGTIPGPQITVRRGQLLEVVLRNQDVNDGVTVHWHGLDVPNAMDGVAGVTQDATPPGGQFTYRFRPEQVGTFWYHTHQNSAVGVAHGLFGTIVVLPDRGPDADSVDAQSVGAQTIDAQTVERVLAAHTGAGRTSPRSAPTPATPSPRSPPAPRCGSGWSTPTACRNAGRSTAPRSPSPPSTAQTCMARPRCATGP